MFARFFWQKTVLLDHLLPMQTGINKMGKRNANANDFKEKYQQNYINKFSTLFIEKESLKAEIIRLNQIIVEQKQTIDKLISNSKKDLVDVDVQTDEIVAADVEIQTDKTNVTDVGNQTGMY